MAKKLKSNEFWGKRSGTITTRKDGSVDHQFRVKTWGNGSNNSGRSR